MASVVEDLIRKHCTPCETGASPLPDTQVSSLLQALTGWARDGERIVKTFKFKDHYQTQAFANAVMWVSHREDHHPDLHVGYNTCRVEYWTHTVSGLSENDFICAAKVDALIDR